MKTYEQLAQIMLHPMTVDQAVELCASKWWIKCPVSPAQIAYLQINQSLLCMDFDDFHASVEIALSRPVLNTSSLSEYRDSIAAELRKLI